MTEKLPITIISSDELCENFEKLKSVANKLEAQLNFQSMTAGWYGDENNILSINLLLETSGGFNFKKQQSYQGIKTEISDDVFSYYFASDNLVECFICITDKELGLLSQKENILSHYLDIKLHKVVNLVAEQFSFHSI